MTTVATPLPTRLVSARHSLMNLSMPMMSASDWIGMSGMIASVAARVTNPAPVTPDAPFEVIMAITRIIISWPMDHHPDQGDEAVAERLERDAGLGEEMPDEDAERNRDRNLNIENGIPGASRGHRSLRRDGPMERGMTNPVPVGNPFAHAGHEALTGAPPRCDITRRNAPPRAADGSFTSAESSGRKCP
jgi:hypothetical protein